MKILFSKSEICMFMVEAFLVTGRGFKTPLGLWDTSVVDDMMEGIGLRDTCDNIEDGHGGDWVVDFNEKEVSFI